MLELAEVNMDRPIKKAIVDRGYRGRRWIGDAEVLTPGKPEKGQSRWLQAKMRKRFRRRAAIEPLIGHLKNDFRLRRCFLKGQLGDSMNLLLASAAWNLRKWMREVLSCFYRALNGRHDIAYIDWRRQIRPLIVRLTPSFAIPSRS